MSLLEKAMSVPRADVRRWADRERVELTELAVAYVTGKVTTRQAAEAIGVQPKAVESTLRSALIMGIRKGLITVAMENGAERNGKK